MMMMMIMIDDDYDDYDDYDDGHRLWLLLYLSRSYRYGMVWLGLGLGYFLSEQGVWLQ